MVTRINPLVTALRQRGMLLGVGILLFALAAMAITSWWPSSLKPPQPTPSEPRFLADLTKIEDHPIENPGFVGPQACVECHRERVHEFQHTRHFHAMAKPDVEFMSKAFSTHAGSWQTQDPTRRFEMQRSGAAFTQTAISTASGTEQRTTTEIAFVYGARAGLDEVYFGWRDGNQLVELPVTWLHTHNTWGHTPFNPNSQDHCGRDAKPRCLECHATWFEYVPGSSNQYRPESFQLGITCEKCHGPGREHVEFHRTHRDTKTAQAIAHPGKLSRDRQMDLCAQCHSNAMKYRRPPLSYRPGEKLDDHFLTLQTSYPEDDHVANQQYLRDSKCYLQSEMTCITCHSPHHVQAHQDPRVAHPACIQCHQPAACTDRENLPAAIQNDCIGCHMPQRRKIQVYFHTDSDSYLAPVGRWEHRIAIYPVAKQEVLWNWHRSQSGPDHEQQAEQLSQALSQHWEQEADERLVNRRWLAAIDAYRLSLQFRDSPEVREKLNQLIQRSKQQDADWYRALELIEQNRLADAVPLLEGCLQEKSDEARVLVKLGTVQAMLGHRELAEKSLRDATRSDPNESGGEAMLGWLAYLAGNGPQAVQHFEKANQIEPRHVKISYQLALALAQAGDYQAAKRQYEYVLTLSPNLAQAFQGLSDIARRTGGTDAIELAQKAVAISKAQDPYLLLTLAEAYLADRQLQAATEVADFSLTLAESKFRAAVPQIRALKRAIENAR